MVSFEPVESAPAPFKQKGGWGPELAWTIQRKEKFLALLQDNKLIITCLELDFSSITNKGNKVKVKVK